MIDESRYGGSGVQELLATNVRRLRIARHLSLSELARATGMSKATLSGIENGRANPTVDTLAGLADALRVSLTDLLGEAPLGEIRISRASEVKPTKSEGSLHRLLDGTALRGALEVAEIGLAARQVRELAPATEGARASVYVLEGKLIAGPVERITELGAGDYMTFPADVPSVLEAGTRPARALLLTQVPG